MIKEYKEYIETPTESISITTNQSVDVTTYATAQVVDADLIASNIKKDVDILGVVGTYEGSATGKLEIHDTTEQNVMNYATAQVVDANLTAANIRQGTAVLGITGTLVPGLVDVATEEELTAKNIAANINCIYRYTGTTGTYVHNQLYRVQSYPLKFTANTAGSTVGITMYGGIERDIKYSRDLINWYDLVPDETIITLAAVNDSIYIKGDNSSGFSEDQYGDYYSFVMTGSINASGNIMSLIDNGKCETTALPARGVFYRLFYGCTALKTMPDLPATTLTAYCYQEMFASSGLVSATGLPATSDNSSYYGMFQNCTSLQTPPEIYVTSLSSYGFRYMFSGCSALTVADTNFSSALVEWKIPKTGTAYNYYAQTNMFTNCAGASYRSTDSPKWNSEQKTFYTQNTPNDFNLSTVLQPYEVLTDYTTPITPLVTSQLIYAKANVLPLYTEITTAAAMNAVNTDANIGKMYKYTGTNADPWHTNCYYIIQHAQHYHIYDASNNELTDWTVSGLATASTYTKGNDTTQHTIGGRIFYVNEDAVENEDDKFFVCNTGQTWSAVQWTAVSGDVAHSFLYQNTIGSGRWLTTQWLKCYSSLSSNQALYYRNSMNSSSLGGCTDWYIGSQLEMEQIRLSEISELVSYFDNYLWSATVSSSNNYSNQVWNGSAWTYKSRYTTQSSQPYIGTIVIRSF